MIQQDIDFVKKVLPTHYTIKESKKASSIHCQSSIGLRTKHGGDDDEHWALFFLAIKKHFGSRFQEVFHNTCAWHSDFTIFLKNPKPQTANK